MAQADPTYPPLDVPKPVADGVWIVDSGPLHLMGLRMPVRMTVIRLCSGALWLHSPTRCAVGLRQALEALGPVGHLVAPNIAHWTFVHDWQRQVPDATVWAAPGLHHRRQVRRSDLRIDHDLSAQAPEAWTGEIDQLVVPGVGGYREVAFLHRPTRTLILTDLVGNLEAEKLPAATRAFARAAGMLGGMAPIYLRASVLLRRREAVEAARRMLAWEPERVIFAHGRWFESGGTDRLRQALDWLLG